MTDAREIIALELARISRIDMSEAPPYARASIHTAALHINRALHDAGFRVLGPDEVDPVTVEKAARIADEQANEEDGAEGFLACKTLEEAIRTIGRKA